MENPFVSLCEHSKMKFRQYVKCGKSEFAAFWARAEASKTTQESEKNTMYSENVYFPDVFKGCLHDCIYCKPSFQRQAKRQKQRCSLCYTFEPHFHKERLLNPSPKTSGKQFVFFPKGGDPCFASEQELACMLQYIRNNPQTTFLMQTKNPKFLLSIKQFPPNLIIGITLESDEQVYNSPSKFKVYSQISKAPDLAQRACDFAKVKHNRKYVIIEPILQFDLAVLVYWLIVINPQVIYVGYDTKNCKLPESTLAETLVLIQKLESLGFEVRRKTIRKAWYETSVSVKEVSK